MTDDIAAAIWLAVLAYFAAGAICFAWLSFGGLARLDPLAAAAPLRVRALIAPGLIGLWPVVLWRAVGVRAPEDTA